MRMLTCLTFMPCCLLLIVAGPASAAGSPIGGMQLLDGYTHQPLQGIDSVVGKIEKKGGLRISYEIGGIPKPGGLRLGGMFSDRAQATHEAQRRWYRELTISGQPVHLAYRKDNQLLASFPTKGMNFSVTVESADQMADALLMILTYPGPATED